MRFLFYLVHPAKYHFHKNQINDLKKRGHQVDVVINTKDILEELVRAENWEYTNIFPRSRKIKGVHVYIAAGISIFKIVYRLLKYTRGKRYDLFIGDLTTILGRILRVPVMLPPKRTGNPGDRCVPYSIPREEHKNAGKEASLEC